MAKKKAEEKSELPPEPPPPPAAEAPPQVSGALAVLLVVGAITVSMIVAAALLLRAKDDSPAGCAATPRVLASLSEAVEATAYVVHGEPSLDQFAVEIERVMARFQTLNGARFKFRLVEAHTPEEKKQAEEDGIRFELLTRGEGQKPVSGYLGLSFKYKGQRAMIPTLSPGLTQASLEFWVTSKVAELKAMVDREETRIGVLSGYGETSIYDKNLQPGPAGSGPSMEGIVEQYFPQTKLEQVDLGKGDIDEGYAGLLMTQPGRDLTDVELRRIEAFVQRGRSLAIVASAVSVAPGDPKMKATLGTHGLEKLLAGYGLELHGDLVLDDKLAFKAKTGDASGPRTPAILGLDSAQFETNSSEFVGVRSLAFPFASSLALRPEAQPQASYRGLARTTDAAASLQEGRALAPSADWPAPMKLGKLLLAASVEGRLKGALTGTVVPEGKVGRVLVIASSGFLTNPFVRSAAPPGSPDADPKMDELALVYKRDWMTSNVVALKNVLGWLAYDDDLAACTPMLAPKD